MTCHNKIRDGVSDLPPPQKPLAREQQPLIQPGQDMRKGKAHMTGSDEKNPTTCRDAAEKKGDLLIHDL